MEPQSTNNYLAVPWYNSCYRLSTLWIKWAVMNWPKNQATIYKTFYGEVQSKFKQLTKNFGATNWSLGLLPFTCPKYIFLPYGSSVLELRN